MRCEHVRERAVEAFLEGDVELPVGLRTHVQSCPECAEEIERLRCAAVAARTLPALTVDPPPAMKSRVFAELGLAGEPTVETPTVLPAAPSSPARVPFSRVLLRRVPLMAAVAVLCIGVALVANRPDPAARNLDSIVRPAVPACENLASALQTDPGSWGDDFITHARVVSEARTALVRVENAEGRRGDLARVAETVSSRRLVEAFGRLVHDSPNPDSRRDAEIVRRALQDIEGYARK